MKWIVPLSILIFLSGCITIGTGIFESEKLIGVKLNGLSGSRYVLVVEQLGSNEEYLVRENGEISIKIPSMRKEYYSVLGVEYRNTNQLESTRIRVLENGRVVKDLVLKEIAGEELVEGEVYEIGI